MRKRQRRPAPGEVLLGVASSPSRGEEQRRHSDFCPHTCQEAGVCLWTLSLLPGPLFASLIYNSKKARRVSARAGAAAGRGQDPISSQSLTVLFIYSLGRAKGHIREKIDGTTQLHSDAPSPGTCKQVDRDAF